MQEDFFVIFIMFIGSIICFPKLLQDVLSEYDLEEFRQQPILTRTF